PPRDLTRIRLHFTIFAALAVVICLAWSNSFNGGLVLDNGYIIQKDARIHAATPANFDLILHRGYWPTAYDAGLYRPFTTLTYLFNYAILGDGENPAGYHVLNLLLHILNAFLVYVLALRLIGKIWTAATVAAVWSLHPVLTEAVTNIVGRADLLATL